VVGRFFTCFWTIGGATASKRTKLLITRPFDLEVKVKVLDPLWSRSLHHCDPWLKTDKIYISDFDLGKMLCRIFSKTYFTSPLFFT